MVEAMIVVKIELHSAITGRVSRLGEIVIANDGTGTANQGNYWGKLYGKKKDVVLRSAVVRGFPRKRLLAHDLLYRILRNALGERNA
jgi:hypothetical protein